MVPRLVNINRITTIEPGHSMGLQLAKLPGNKQVRQIRLDRQIDRQTEEKPQDLLSAPPPQFF